MNYIFWRIFWQC